MYLYTQQKNKGASQGSKKPERIGGEAGRWWQNVRCILASPATNVLNSTPVTVNSLEGHGANQISKAIFYQGTWWWKDTAKHFAWEFQKARCRWQGRVRAQKKKKLLMEHGVYEVSHARSSGVQLLCFSFNNHRYGLTFTWLPIYTMPVKASNLGDTHCSVKIAWDS